jgi:hypothetical protein
MFSEAGDHAVGRAVVSRLLQVRERRAEGYALTEQRLHELVAEVQTEVSRIGYDEVYDTAVREVLYGEFAGDTAGVVS